MAFFFGAPVLDALSEKFERILKKLRGQGVLTEDNIAEALKEVRLALLEADVNFKVVKDFLERVREKAVGQEVLKSLTPGHQVVKVVWDELRGMMGGERSGISLASRPPTILMMVGLQGAGENDHLRKAGPLIQESRKAGVACGGRPASPCRRRSVGEPRTRPWYRCSSV
jgi:signal recognition particle subunit SRP54